jgi:acetyltransferase-like isoleucine patch superfamily enzyme
MNKDEQNQTSFQSRLSSDGESGLEQYARIAVGEPGLWPVFRYDLAAWFLAPMPGALGLALRSKFYPGMFRSCGKGLVLGRNICIRHPGRIALGRGVMIDDSCVLDAKGESSEGITIGDGVAVARDTILSCKGGSIEIGDNSNLSAKCLLMSETKLTIGKNVLVAGMCYIVAGGNHGMDRTDIPIIQQPMVDKGGVRIGDNCWLGARVTVLDGVTIGNDAVIGAGAVVTRDVPDFAVAAGVPAKVIRMRSYLLGVGRRHQVSGIGYQASPNPPNPPLLRGGAQIPKA